MAVIDPGSKEEGSRLLAHLAVAAGKQLGVEIKPYDVTKTADRSQDIHWMYKFDEFESRIYRVQGGFQNFVDIKPGSGQTIDIDDVVEQINQAYLQLTQEAL